MVGKIYDAMKRVQCLVRCLSRHKYMKSTAEVNDLASDISNNRSSMLIGRKAEHIYTRTGSETCGIGSQWKFFSDCSYFLSEIEKNKLLRIRFGPKT